MAYTGARPSYVSFPVDYFSGNGVTTAFNLTYPASAEGSVLVTVNNQHVYANKYSVNNKSLVFINYIPPVGVNNIEVIYLGIPAISENVLGVTSVGIISNLAGITVGNSPVITSGVMSLNGTLAVGSGGTGATSYGNNLLLVGNGSNPINTLANTGASNQALISNGTGSNPSWQNIVNSFSAGTTGLTPSSASTGAITLSGTLNVASGGTGVTTLPINQVLLGNANSPISTVVGTGTVGQILTSQGANPPSWQTPTFGSGTVTSVALTMPAGFDVANSPVTTTGGFTVTYSGLIPTASLGSGTSDNTTYLRGDGAWATLPTNGTVTSIGLSTTLSGITISGSPVTTSGTIEIGGILNVTHGGTGSVSLASNSLLLGNGTSPIGSIPNGTLGQLLTSNGAGASPSWQTLVYVSTISGGTTGLTPSSASSGVVVLSGTLNVANGGTGTTNLASGQLLLGNGSSAISSLSNGANGQFLSISSGALNWQTAVTSVAISTTLSGITITGSPITSSGTIQIEGTLNVANGGTGTTSLNANEILLGNGSSAITSLANGTNNQQLVISGGLPSWQTPAYTQTFTSESDAPAVGGFALCNIGSGGPSTPPLVGSTITQTSSGYLSYGGAGSSNWLPAGTYVVIGRNGATGTSSLLVSRTA